MYGGGTTNCVYEVCAGAGAGGDAAEEEATLGGGQEAKEEERPNPSIQPAITEGKGRTRAVRDH